MQVDGEQQILKSVGHTVFQKNIVIFGGVDYCLLVLNAAKELLWQIRNRESIPGPQKQDQGQTLKPQK